jgi:uncharacterized membrane protein YhiD involved in acid resistance
MNIGLLVDAAIGILSGYGIKLAKNAGEAALQVANQIFDAIQNHFSANETARQTLDLYKADPETFESALRTILQRELEQSEAFALRLQELVDALKEVTPADVVSQIIVTGSGAAATGHSVAAGKGGYAAGRDLHIGSRPKEKD